MRTKYNDLCERVVNHGRSNIDKYLSDELEYLLASSNNQYSDSDLSKVFIPNKDAEEFLVSLLRPIGTDRVRFLTGLTGSGKTTLIRHALLRDSSNPIIIQEETLTICFSFNNLQENYIHDYFANMTQSAAEKIEKQYEIKNITNYSADFYEYIQSTRPDFAQTGPKFPERDYYEKLICYSTEHPLAFTTSKLKFYLNQCNCPINNIILIIDDLEGLMIDEPEPFDGTHELLPVKLLHELITCLENNPNNRKWEVNAVISCRHYIYRLMSSTYITDEVTYTKALNSYSGGLCFDLSNPPSIKDIIDKRFRMLKPRINCEKWELAYNVSLYILLDIEAKLGDLILALNLNNIREALLCLRQLVCNKRWIQRDYLEFVDGAFKIDDIKRYDINVPSLIRALGMKESTIYSSKDSCIPNVFCNDDEEISDFIVLLTLKYFLVACNEKKMSWSASFSVSKFLKKVNKIFDTEGKTDYQVVFHNALANLILYRVLLRSSDQLQKETKALTFEKAKEIEKVYVPDSAIMLWRYLADNSVLFEMYVDDTWMEQTYRKDKRQFRGFDEENYSICLEYLEHLSEIESGMHVHTKNLDTHELYLDCFGKDSVCGWLLKGLQKSLSNFYRETRSESESFVKYCGTSLELLERKIRNYTICNI